MISKKFWFGFILIYNSITRFMHWYFGRDSSPDPVLGGQSKIKKVDLLFQTVYGSVEKHACEQNWAYVNCCWQVVQKLKTNFLGFRLILNKIVLNDFE